MNQWLMVVDMQIWFLAQDTTRVKKLISNTCNLITDALETWKKIFVVEFLWNWRIHPKIMEALWNWELFRIKKSKQHFFVLERDVWEIWLLRKYLDDIKEIQLCWVHTNHCVRAAYNTLMHENCSPKICLWSTLNLNQTSTSIEQVVNYYRCFSKLEPQFVWYESDKNTLEDYL